MAISIVIVFTILAIHAEARRPRIEMYEIQLKSSSSEERDYPFLKRINEVPKLTSGAAQVASHVVDQIDLLLGGQDVQSSSDSSLETFIDNTRSSIVLVPRDGDAVYHIVRELKPKPAEKKGWSVIPLISSQQKGNNDKRRGVKRQKREDKKPLERLQWDVLFPPKHK